MTGIGETLREARVRRRIELAQIEAETKIRAGYLAALEEERLDALPGKAYAKAFLRSYARYLGLPAEAMVAELDARLSPDEPSIAPLRMRPGRSFRVPAPALPQDRCCRTERPRTAPRANNLSSGHAW